MCVTLNGRSCPVPIGIDLRFSRPDAGSPTSPDTHRLEASTRLDHCTRDWWLSFHPTGVEIDGIHIEAVSKQDCARRIPLGHGRFKWAPFHSKRSSAGFGKTREKRGIKGENAIKRQGNRQESNHNSIPPSLSSTVIISRVNRPSLAGRSIHLVASLPKYLPFRLRSSI